MTINADKTTISIGESLQLSVTSNPQLNQNQFAWSIWTNNTGNATIDENGLLTATQSGTITVIAKALDGSLKDATKTITIVE